MDSHERGAAVRRIVANPEILGGKPILAGTRLSVAHILGLLSHGMSHNDIVDSHPELSIADINTVVQYAARLQYAISYMTAPKQVT